MGRGRRLPTQFQPVREARARARYRVMGQHEESAATAAGDEHVDEAWTRVPAEGWAPLDHLNLR